MAVLVAKPGESIDYAHLIRFLEPRMAHFMVPRYLEVIDELPKTQTGKIQKFTLRARGLGPRTWDRQAARRHRRAIGRAVVAELACTLARSRGHPR